MDTKWHHPHQQYHLQSSDKLTDMVIGMSDGLTIPFALAAGLSGALMNTHLIAAAVLAAIAAGSIAMGWSGYTAGKTKAIHFRGEWTKENNEAERIPDSASEAFKTFLANLGLSPDIQNKATEAFTKEKKDWIDFRKKHELDPEIPDPASARKSALNIGLSYFAGGIIPLFPYFFWQDPISALKISAIITLSCLFIFGYFRSKITGMPPVTGAFKVMLTGAVAAACAFGIAQLISA